jgi:uncharacterized C2H2 Zn-finger protein
MKVEMELESKSCPTCGVVYAVSKDWYAALGRAHDRGDADTKWYCPNGHATVFSREARIPELERELNRAKQENARLEEAAAEAQRETRKAWAEQKRTKRRAVAALCPCCNRSFRQLAHHMRSQHPEEAAAIIVEGRAKGGKARAAGMTPEQRSAIAKTAAVARWHGGANGQ